MIARFSSVVPTSYSIVRQYHLFVCNLVFISQASGTTGGIPGSFRGTR